MNVFWHCSTVKTVVGSAIGSKYRDVEVSRASLIKAVMHGSMCSAIITVVDDAKVDSLLDAQHKMDKETEQLGLRAFVWNVEKTI